MVNIFSWFIAFLVARLAKPSMISKFAANHPIRFLTLSFIGILFYNTKFLCWYFVGKQNQNKLYQLC
jgi:hypothetical protein